MERIKPKETYKVYNTSSQTNGEDNNKPGCKLVRMHGHIPVTAADSRPVMFPCELGLKKNPVITDPTYRNRPTLDFFYENNVYFR